MWEEYWSTVIDRTIECRATKKKILRWAPIFCNHNFEVRGGVINTTTESTTLYYRSFCERFFVFLFDVQIRAKVDYGILWCTLHVGLSTQTLWTFCSWFIFITVSVSSFFDKFKSVIWASSCHDLATYLYMQCCWANNQQTTSRSDQKAKSGAQL